MESEVRNNSIDRKLIQETLFSKENISNINKKLLEKYNLMEINRDNKKKIIELLIKNMKTVFKSLDFSKINSSNAKSISNQFNMISFENTEKELGKDNILAMLMPNASEKKFERDFHSNPNSGNKIMDRPQAVSHRGQQQQQQQPFQQQFQQQQQKQQQPFLFPPDYKQNDPRMNDSRFDKLFKPIVDDLDDNYQFNQYQNGKGGEEFSNKYDQLRAERDSETVIQKRPSTPDFLKPVQTSVRQQSENDNRRGEKRGVPQVRRRNGKPNFQEDIPDEEKDMGFLSANDNNDLYDVNNIDRPIEIPEIQEDSRPFEQRLQSLERDRGNIQIRKSNKKINFQDPDLMNKIEEEDENFEDLDEQPKSIDEIKREKEKRKLMMMKAKEIEERQRLQRENEDDDDEEEYVPQVRSKPIVKMQDRKVDMEKIKEALKKLKVNENLVDMNSLIKENEQLKKQLNQLSEMDDKHRFEFIKKEIGTEFTKLHERENEMNKKEDELKNLLKKYNFLYGLKHIQMDITPQNPVSKYTFNFNPIENIIAIKLMSYSIPVPRYNIEENKNNILKIKKNGEIEEIRINSGKYKIEDLVNTLNKKSNYNFELDFEEKIIIKNKNEEKFDIIPTSLSVDVLGFIGDYKDNYEFRAARTWDLRIEDKIYLFLNNIEENVPFAVIYIGNQAVQQFRFEEPINLDNLQVEFKDSRYRPYNFYGLQYSINVQLEISNPNEDNLTI